MQAEKAVRVREAAAIDWRPVVAAMQLSPLQMRLAAESHLEVGTQHQIEQEVSDSGAPFELLERSVR